MLHYRKVLNAIKDECIKIGRDPYSVKLAVVTKNQTAQAIQEAYNAGARLFAESRVQDALPKQQELPEDCEWHFIGPLQKNKVRKVVGNFSLIHSVDSVDLAKKINEVSQELTLVSSILLQVNTSGETSKQGFTTDSLIASYEELHALPHINIRGLMTMAPYTEDTSIQLATFSALEKLNKQLGLHELSMGMSNDWQAALQCGATVLRIGSSIFNES